ncbi:MAG: hypothetical protein ACOYXT_06380 [Bacteroidota bacterium]
MKRKSILNLAIVLAVIVTAFACSGKKEENKPEETASASHEEWKEMDEFHMVMAEAFHPFKDSANLAPVKEKAEELATVAEKWAAAAIPEKVNNDEVKAKLAQLKTDAAALVGTVKAGDDKVIGESLTKLHDLFHEIQEAWYGGHGHEHH